MTETWGVVLALLGTALTLLMGAGSSRWRGVRLAAAAVLLASAIVLVLPRWLPAPPVEVALPDSLGELRIGLRDDEPSGPPAAPKTERRSGQPPAPRKEPPPTPNPQPKREPAPNNEPKKQAVPLPPARPTPKEPSKPPQRQDKPASAASDQKKAAAPAAGGKGIDSRAFWQLVNTAWDRVVSRGGKTGPYSVSLCWDNKNDLDLYVATADGEEIWFSNPESKCGGTIDVDSNVSGSHLTDTPVENIVWPEGRKPKGPIKIYVGYFQQREHAGCKDPTKFRIVVRDGGRLPRLFVGEITHDQSNQLRTKLVAEVEIR